MVTYTRIIENLTLTSTMSLIGPEWDNTLIRNITIKDVKGDGIMIRDVSNLRIENVTIDNVTGDGIKLSTLGSTSNVIIANSTITNTGGDGINASQRKENGVDHTGLQIINNTIDTTGLSGSNDGLIHGIYVQSTDFLIEGNRVLNSMDGNAISVRSSGVVRDNYIENARESGVAYFADNYTGPSDELIIENNTIVNAGVGTTRSDINMLNVSSGQKDAAVGNIIIRDNNLTDDDGRPVDVSDSYARYGINVQMSNNTVDAEERNENGTSRSDQMNGTAGRDALYGLDGNDTMNGGTGDDKLFGGAGNDVMSGDENDDMIDGGSGTDRVVYSSVSVVVDLSLTGAQNTGQGLDTLVSIEDVTSGKGNDRLTGNAVANKLAAGTGNDTLNGGAGNDTMFGGTGDDIFVFNTALGASNIDRITDYNVSADTIHLENAVFAGLTAGKLASQAFQANTTGYAVDASDRIIYETDTGRLYFDADGTGSGARVHFATLTSHLNLTSGDFFII